MAVTNFSNYQFSGKTTEPNMIKPVNPNWERDLVDVEVLTDSEVGLCSFVETIQTAGTDADRYKITDGTEESKTIWLFIPKTIDNIRVLEADNGAAWTYAQLFSAGSKIKAHVIQAGDVLGAILAAQQGTVLGGKKLVKSGTVRALKIHPEDLAVDTHTTGTTVTDTVSGILSDPTIATMLCRATTSAATQYIVVKARGA